jgi:hypothetical protein
VSKKPEPLDILAGKEGSFMAEKIVAVRKNGEGDLTAV